MNSTDLKDETGLSLSNKSAKAIFILLLIICLTPYISPPIALLLGLITANVIGHPFLSYNRKATTILLQVSVVGLGFGMNVETALAAGRQGIVFTVVSILSTLIIGYYLGKQLKTDNKTSMLISTGTAICGGSAIAAISPIIKAEEKQISVALGTVFILNSVALFVFPMIGHLLNLSQIQFGLWSAIAIHDTSSVVGAASKYGSIALQTATTVKLARALWIIPIALVTSFFVKNKSAKIKFPYFIGYFILAIIVNTYFTSISLVSPYIVSISKTGLTVTLFLIGAGLNRSVIRTVGIKPMIQGVILWILISVSSLLVIMDVVK